MQRTYALRSVTVVIITPAENNKKSRRSFRQSALLPKSLQTTSMRPSTLRLLAQIPGPWLLLFIAEAITILTQAGAIFPRSILLPYV